MHFLMQRCQTALRVPPVSGGSGGGQDGVGSVAGGERPDWGADGRRRGGGQRGGWRGAPEGQGDVVCCYNVGKGNRNSSFVSYCSWYEEIHVAHVAGRLARCFGKGKGDEDSFVKVERQLREEGKWPKEEESKKLKKKRKGKNKEEEEGEKENAGKKDSQSSKKQSTTKRKGKQKVRGANDVEEEGDQ